MTPLSGLLRLATRVSVAAAWFVRGRLCPLVAWLWRRSRLFLASRVFTPAATYVHLAVGWRGERGSANEPEVTDGGDGVGETRVEEGRREAGPGTAGPGDTDGEEDAALYRADPADELYCGYDSTWEAEVSDERTLAGSWRPAAPRPYKFSRFENAARDMYNYRHDYPSQIRVQPWSQNVPSDDKPNLCFYLGKKPSLPDGVYIHNFHNDWYGNYDKLEYVHTYIQWLFPLQEPGMNNDASTLTKGEIEDFLANGTARENLLRSYELMLDFYGIMLCNEKTGEVKRASHWRDRFCNLNNHTHNNLRITRILKCLGTLGFPHYQAPLVHFFLMETLVRGELPNIKDSVLNYFVFAVLDKRERRNLVKFAYLNYDRKDEFVWCPRKIQMMWSGLSASEPGDGDKKDGYEL
ncbi:opioid growth factor receptor-like protein 1 [Scophthalmus maximus]|uniref:Opioid growth factor receptor 2 n=1 Tax=Scophthalmus maximus TaxID=52904 RepID=A0A8D3E134_SCOMX|nr:opioid growth factor receptor-like protein 1 [Scophthalmus maximus]